MTDEKGLDTLTIKNTAYRKKISVHAFFHCGMRLGRAFFLIAMALAAWLAAFNGCSDSTRDRNKPYLVMVGDHTLSVTDFNRAFNVAKMSYSDKLSDNCPEFVRARADLLGELTEELILLQRADEMGVTVSDIELQEAIAEVKADYPEQTFEKVLLEAAIPYSYWEENLRRRLLKEAVIEKDLESAMKVTPDEIARFYNSFFGQDAPDETVESEDDRIDQDDAVAEEEKEDRPEEAESEPAEPYPDPEALSERIIRQLKKEKVRRIYPAYIEKLKNKYEIKINQSAWRKIAG